MGRYREILGSLLIAVMASSAVFASYEPAAIIQRPDQQGLRWKTKQIRVSLSSSLTQPSFNIKSDSDVIGAVMRSFRTWQDVANIEFVTDFSEKQGISPSGAGDGVSLITIAQTPENVLLFSKEPDRESAKTRVFYSKGAITEADIVLNPFQSFSTDGTYGTFDLQATLTHEIGHMLGLRHSAVLGATMSESLPKNGTFGISDLGARELSRNDIASIRDLYDFQNTEQKCCGVITGRLTGPAGRTMKGSLRVWAEESESGRLVAQTDASSDGSFRLGGLGDSAYTVLWQVRDEDVSAVGEIGSAVIQEGNTVTLNGKIAQRPVSPAVEFIGINSSLANTAIPVKSGRDYIVYLGGKDLDPKSIGVQFNSPFLRVVPGTYSRSGIGDGTSVLSLIVSVDADAPSGLYTLFATGANGSKASLLGALKVD